MRRCLRHLAPALTCHVPSEACHTANAEAKAQADEWHVTPATYAAATAKAKDLGYAGDKLIMFLCAKGVQPSGILMGDGTLKTSFELVVKPPDEDWTNRRNALLDILGTPSSSDPQVGTFQKVPDEISFASFVAAHPQWGPGDKSWVFFRDHPAVKGHNVLTQRVQIFGSCAIHAPVTLQHYLVALHTKGATEETLNMPMWLRKHASPEILKGIVFENGVVSGTVLDSILIPAPLSNRPACTLSDFPSDFPSKMAQYGPGLVASWRVAKGFNTFPSSAGPHLGKPPAEDPLKKDGRHAMLVVGYRCTEGGELRLLLQNWWKSKQFVEVDEAYFRGCNGTEVRFVTTPQTHFPPTIEVTADAYAVCAADGAGVSGIGEPSMGQEGRALRFSRPL